MSVALPFRPPRSAGAGARSVDCVGDVRPSHTSLASTPPLVTTIRRCGVHHSCCRRLVGVPWGRTLTINAPWRVVQRGGAVREEQRGGVDGSAPRGRRGVAGGRGQAARSGTFRQGSSGAALLLRNPEVLLMAGSSYNRIRRRQSSVAEADASSNRTNRCKVGTTLLTTVPATRTAPWRSGTVPIRTAGE